LKTKKSLNSRPVVYYIPCDLCFFFFFFFFIFLFLYLFIYHTQNDYEADGRILNVSFSAKRPDLPGEVLYTQQFLQERVYLRRHALTKLTTLQVIMFTPLYTHHLLLRRYITISDVVRMIQTSLRNEQTHKIAKLHSFHSSINFLY
jgi:hypothetical protein